MENLNAEQVKKALEGHIGVVDMRCEECPYNQDNGSEICIDLLMTDSLALINSQEQRIGELEQCWEHEHASAMEIFGQWSEKCERLTEENERLRAENEALAISEVKECEISQMLVYRIRDKHPAVMAVKADTIDEFVKRVKEKMREVATGKRTSLVGIGWLDQIAKEMLEGGNNNE